MPEHLIIHLEAPLLAFGGVTIDNFGFTRDFPARSMLTGLFANAFGWTRADKEQHQRLQDRLIFAARRDREAYIGHLQDVQNARLAKNDKGWTTSGTPEGRTGGDKTYTAPHRRFRDYHPDALVIIALRLDPASEEPDLTKLATALERPARPLFFGRKPCLPSSPLIKKSHPHIIEATTVGEALAQVPLPSDCPNPRALWPELEAPTSPHQIDKITPICDERNWRSGLHGGSRLIVEGRIGEAGQ